VEVTRKNLSRALITAAVIGAALGLVAPAAAQADTLGYDPAADVGSLSQVASVIGARAQYAAGNTGQGVDVAVIDTGVARVPGLTNVVNGPDLSFDSQGNGTRYTDLYGHGTHMASIIAGRDSDGSGSGVLNDSGGFEGVAPGSRIVNVKVGASDGTVDVTQVVAAITWVTQHAHDNGLNIRVINLSYGTNSAQSYTTDPLAYAAQVAWQAGILVVAAGGNDASTRATLADPALSPNLLAVGAEDTAGTATTADDTVPAFSQRGVGRHVDLVAPGVHLVGLRVPNGVVDTRFPASRVGTRFTRGSGTSQASAVVSGAAALLLAARPNLRPDQVKYLLTSTATPLPQETAQTSGAGLINVDAAVKAATPGVTKLKRTLGTGAGSIEAARGTTHVSLGGVPLTGEKDIFSQTWKPAPFAATTAGLSSWNGAKYQGNVWTGNKFGTNGDWAAATWTGTDWTGRTWVAEDWAGRTWVDSTWSATAWKSGPWSSGSWS
jgi:serine protease AprX